MTKEPTNYRRDLFTILDVFSTGEAGALAGYRQAERDRHPLEYRDGSTAMTSGNRSVLAKLLVPGGTLYLVSLAFQSPPVRWVGIGCLAVVVPLLLGWVLGNVAGVGPWADTDVE